jgi:uncharacterized repeat protein (TIGR01451 family)
MKKYFFLFILHSYSIFLFSQSSDWKIIGTPSPISVILQYQASDGTLFGEMPSSNNLFFSVNNGETWVELNNVSLVYYNPNFYSQFKESKNGEIYFYSGNKLCLFDKVNLTFIELINFNQTGSNFEIRDFTILHNGEIVVGLKNSLQVYSSSGTLKSIVNFPLDLYKFLFSKDSTSNHYAIMITDNNTHFITEFSPDLNFIGNEKKIDPITTYDIIRSEDRLLGTKSYSDDFGATWQQYSGESSGFIQKIIVGFNKKIYFVGKYGVGVYESQDNGKTREILSLAIDNVSYISSTNDNVMVIATDESCNEEIFISTDNGLNFKETKHDIGPHYVSKIYPSTNEDIFAFTCNLHRKISPINGWKIVPSIENNGIQVKLEGVYPLSNNELIGVSYNNDLFKSSNYGTTWIPLNNNSYFSNIYNHNLTEKKDIIYHLDRDSLATSKDFGSTWQRVAHNPHVKDPSYFDFNNQGDMYYFNYGDTLKTINKLNIYSREDEKIMDLPNNLNAKIIVTSFDGKHVYILLENNEIYEFYHIDVDGQTFQTTNVSDFFKNQYLQTDHLGNLYTYNSNQVFMSSDHGVTWADISPTHPNIINIVDLKVSYDNYLYIATLNIVILKYNPQLSKPKRLDVSLYEDDNKNCVQDENEQTISQGKIVVNNNHVKLLDTNGVATFYLNQDQNKVSVEFNDKIYEYCQASYDVDLSTGTNAIAIPLKTKKYCADLVTSISTPFLRRCFDNTYYGQVCNEGNIDAEETEVKIILDDYFDLIQANLPQLSHVGNELTLDAGTIKPGECKNINFTINLSCDATLGQEHCIIIDSESRSQSCNSIETRTEYTECQDNIGSFDPNDKAIFVNGVRNQTYLEPGDKLEYMIRFQNTGTDTAFTVKIQDPISTKFDVASMRPVAASHDYIWSVDNGTLNVVFNQIMLVDSFKNEPASHGFIKFEITLDEKTMLNEEVSNVAGIYFDFNEPIITNEVFTPVGKPVFTNDWSVSPFFIYPNPTTDFLSLGINDAKFNIGKVNIFDQKGGKLLTTDFNIGLSNRINVSQLPSGFYIIQVVNNKSEFKTKFVKL